MKIIIRSQTREILLQTVTTTQNVDNPDNTNLFRCYRCGTGIAQIKGEVTAISAGLVPTDDAVTFYMCYRCGEHYTFQNQKSKIGRVKLVLSPEIGKPTSSFKCIVCRTECLVFGPTIKGMPFDFTCPNNTCGREYKLRDVVSLSDVI